MSRSKNSIRKAEKIVLIPDVHAPFQDHDAFELACRAIETFRPEVVVCLGDFADCFMVSFHRKSPHRKLKFRDELAQTAEAWRRFDKACNRVKRRIYCLGNHEFRLQRYIIEKAPELHGFIEITDEMQVDHSRWEVIPYQDYATVGSLVVTHDFGSHGQNAHRNELRKLGNSFSIAMGHTHRMAVESHTTMDGKVVQAGMFGWLGDKEAIDYRHRAKLSEWQHSIGFGYVLPGNNTVVHGCPLVDNTVVLGNKMISG